MPWNKKLYPHDWSVIAKQVKDEAGWKCEECGRPCRKPGEARTEFEKRLIDSYHPSLVEFYEKRYTRDGFIYDKKFGKFVLTVAHLNHKPSDCRRENLRAWCSPCHLRYDTSQISVKRFLKRERHGQLSLFEKEDTVL